MNIAKASVVFGLILVLLVVVILLTRCLESDSPYKGSGSVGERSEVKNNHNSLANDQIVEPITSSENHHRLGPDPAADEGAQYLHFIYSDGSVAKGLRVRRSNGDDGPLQILDKLPEWPLKLNENGALRCDEPVGVDTVVYIRLSSDAIEVVPIVPGSLTYTLPVSVRQRFSILPLDATSGVTVRLESANLGRANSNFEFRDAVRNGRFAEAVSVSGASPGRDQVTLACLVLRAELGQDGLATRLPIGQYDLIPMVSPFGYWLDQRALNITGLPVELVCRAVPIANLFLPQENVIRGIEVSTVSMRVQELMPDGSGATTWISIPWLQSGDRVQVALRWRPTEGELYQQYSLRLLLTDGSTLTTPAGSWDSLLAAYNFNH